MVLEKMVRESSTIAKNVGLTLQYHKHVVLTDLQRFVGDRPSVVRLGDSAVSLATPEVCPIDPGGIPKGEATHDVERHIRLVSRSVKVTSEEQVAPVEPLRCKYKL